MKKNYNYFDTFVKMVDYSCQSAEILHATLKTFAFDRLEDKMQEMHEIEHKADMEQHEMRNVLAREFIAPIEREDIMSLSQEIDDVTDAVEDVLIRFYMFHITSLRTEALEFSEVILNCCKALKKAMEDFHNFKKSKTITESLIEVDRLEEVGDSLYSKAMHRLYVEHGDPIEVIAWTAMFDRFEKCCDACEHVAHVMSSIIMKNT